MLINWRVAAVVFSSTHVARAVFGAISSGGQYVIDTGSSPPLVFKIGQTLCDITSITYQGLEYQYQAQTSRVNSGLGGSTISAATYPTYIKITCATPTLTHYYVARKGFAVIYTATYITAPPAVGELAFNFRFNKEYLPIGDVESYTDLGTATVDGSVVKDANGYTYSRFYSNKRVIDLGRITIQSSDVAASLVIPDSAQESSAGGPFKREITSERTTSHHGVFWYMYSKNLQPEVMRLGLYGPVGLVFSPPNQASTPLDVSFFATLGITDYIPTSGRGLISGNVSGITNNFQTVLHWYNSNAQYWAVANSTGSFTSPEMKPGTYTMAVYRDEYELSKLTVTVAAGTTSTSNIGAPSFTTPIWSIGELNGQPKGFENADLQTEMHPTDVRMAAWTPTSFLVNTNPVSLFPMAQIKGINDPTKVTFHLSTVVGLATLKIGSTLSFSSGRPQVLVNSWLSPAPAAPVAVGITPGLTRGSYRGENHVYSFTIPVGVLVQGSNSIEIRTISGSSSSDAFLSPHFIYDAVVLYPGNA